MRKLLLSHPCDPSTQPPATPHDVAVIPGERPGSVLRVRVDPAQQAVLLEQMGHSESLGWYRQKLTMIPQHMLGDIATALREAACLLNTTQPAPTQTTSYLRLCDGSAAGDAA